VREHALAFPGFSLGAGAVAGAGTAPTGGPGAAESVTKAGEAIRGLFNRGKK
jgi:hypothetical protein